MFREKCVSERVTGRAVGVCSEEEGAKQFVVRGVHNFVLNIALKRIENSVDRSMQMYEKWKKTS